MIFSRRTSTLTGGLMKIYDGPAMIAEKTGADIVTVRIDGLQFTPSPACEASCRYACFPAFPDRPARAQSKSIPPCMDGRGATKRAASPIA